MRMRAFIAVFVAFYIADIGALRYASAAPAPNALRALSHAGHFQLVEDTCWWWGTRWQYGWRGYGWYPCWDWTKPQPTIIAPEEVPPGALTTGCVQTWRDASGALHSRRC
jgi:hypothetical protein